MKTVLDLLNPPCPEDALGQDLVGFDLDSPLIPELEALFERFRRNTDLPDDLGLEGGQFDVEKEAEYNALLVRWVDLRKQAIGPLRTIVSRRVPARSLLAWFQQSAQWTDLARSDFHRALHLWTRYGTLTEERAGECARALSESNYFEILEEGESSRSDWKTRMIEEAKTRIDAEDAELSQSHRWQARLRLDTFIAEGLLGGGFQPTEMYIYTTTSPNQRTLRALDAVLAIWEEPAPQSVDSPTLPHSKEDALATPGVSMGTRILAEGELLEFQDHPWKYWQNEYLQVHGNRRVRFKAPVLTEAQKGYINTFYAPDSDYWPRSPEPSQALSEAMSAKLELKPITLQEGDDEDWRLIITPQPSSAQWPAWGTYLHASLHEAAEQAGWTKMDAVNGRLFLEALREERLVGTFALYPDNGYMLLPTRCAVAPSDEVIIEALRSMLVAGRATSASSCVFPSKGDLLLEARRLTNSIPVLSAVQPTQDPGGTDAINRD